MRKGLCRSGGSPQWAQGRTHTAFGTCSEQRADLAQALSLRVLCRSSAGLERVP